MDFQVVGPIGSVVMEFANLRCSGRDMASATGARRKASPAFGCLMGQSYWPRFIGMKRMVSAK